MGSAVSKVNLVNVGLLDSGESQALQGDKVSKVSGESKEALAAMALVFLAAQCHLHLSLARLASFTSTSISGQSMGLRVLMGGQMEYL
jgi:hypothetical protein